MKKGTKAASMGAEDPGHYVELVTSFRWSGFSLKGARSSLWLGGDHLLMVEESNFCERYKRFYLKDIKAITVNKTGYFKKLFGGFGMFLLAWAIFGVLLAFVGAFCFAELNGIKWLDMFFLIQSIVGFCILGTAVGIAAISLAILIFNYFCAVREASCICHIHTSIQEEALLPIKSMRHARKALAKIQVAIERVQGALAETDYTEIARTLCKNRSFASAAPAMSEGSAS